MSPQRSSELSNELAVKKRKTNSFDLPADTLSCEHKGNENTNEVASHACSGSALLGVAECDIGMAKKQVLRQLNGNFVNLSEAPALSEKYKEVYTIFERTIKDKESHSVILVGPRSSGKTSIVKDALLKLNAEFKNQFIAIHLNSSVYTDDTTALREIARQLDIKVNEDDSDEYMDAGDDDEKEEDEKPADDKNETPLPEETDGEENNFARFETKSINETFANILSVLNSEHEGEETKMPLIFVIDEFEKFTTSTRQTLLYNLLDLSQSSDTPICVIGLTTKMTTKESLEKRVNSRFSQRVISILHENSLESFWNNAKLSLSLNRSVRAKFQNPAYGEQWNAHVDQLFSKDDSFLKKLVARNYYTIKDYKEFNNLCKFPVSRLSRQQPYLNEEHFKANISGCEGIQTQVRALSDLELLLVIAAARWIHKYEIQTINFNLAYKEYQDMVKEYNIGNASVSLENRITSNIRVNQKVWSQKVLLNSWCSLYKIGILLDPRNDAAENRIKAYSYNINKNLIIEESQMLLLDITLDELSSFFDDKHNFKKYLRL
ncbi:Origin recognition complex subunit 4 [Candida viswanathii]|uniref:Origin recognition complex subunit 4 n=1 Tax=Candida viswanathii TaxID=5486 RepID=A0A367YBU3_9ASCO|nr:Origin recognition complex subunit 4 [Candida viswanathii]